MEIPVEKLDVCLEVLQQISEDPSVISGHERMKSLIAKIHREGKRSARHAEREVEQTEARRLRAQTAVVDSQRAHRPYASINDTALMSDNALSKPTRCYICKNLYTELHFFYHMLCPACAAFNYAKRHQRADLTGRVALVTGGRIKIGFQTALRLLRDGARVLVTTRFPRDAALRFSAEPDFQHWQERLQIFGMDFRNLSAVEAFIHHQLKTETHLDILINNAAQTIRRPPEFYQELLEQEQSPRDSLPGSTRSLVQSFLPQNLTLLSGETEPENSLPALKTGVITSQRDADGQPLDLRSRNSWSLKLDEVGSVEMLEVQLIGVTMPFLLNSQLKPLFLRSPFARRFIVNVSAMEGQFQRAAKTVNHPHTNMAKAALNMMTRTSAADYARDGIFMNSVDTGWITDENPHPKKTRLQESDGFYTPLDVMDGMARIYDPIVQSLKETSEPVYGHFLKDYAPCPW